MKIKAILSHPFLLNQLTKYYARSRVVPNNPVCLPGVVERIAPPTRFTGWSSNPPCDWFGDKPFKEIIKIKWGHKWEALTIRLVLIGRGGDTRSACAQRKPTQGHSEKEAEERGLRRNEICRHLDLGLPACRIVRNTFLLFKPLQTVAALVDY